MGRKPDTENTALKHGLGIEGGWRIDAEFVVVSRMVL